MTDEISTDDEPLGDRVVFAEPEKAVSAARTDDISSLRVRDFLKADFEILLKLDQECFPPGIVYSRDELLHYLSRPRAITLVAESDESRTCGFVVAESGRAVATASLPVRACFGHIITIDVSGKARRAGVGSILMSEIEARLKAMHCSRIYLEVAVDNLSAISFYKRRGYAIVKTLPRYYDRALDGLRMEKLLV